MKKCSTGKIVYISLSIAEDALIDAWSRHNYAVGKGPVNVYQCDDCGNFHFTSKGTMNIRLKTELENGSIARSRRAFELESGLKRR